MKKKWENPKLESLLVNKTCNEGVVTCTLGIPTWPSGMIGPVWNSGEKEWQCSSMGQGQGVNAHLPDGDINKIPRCMHIHDNNKTCLASSNIPTS